MTTRDILRNAVDGFIEKIHEAEGWRATDSKDLMNLVYQAVDGDPDAKKYMTARNSLDLCEAVLVELHERLRAARLNLWQHDLEAQKAEYGKAAKAATDARLEVLQCQSDKTNYLRAAGSVTHEEKADHIANYDILLVDARSRANLTANYRDKAKRDLEAMQDEYNAVCVELGGPIEPEHFAPGSVPAF